jgi:hypothetical protein
MAGYEGLSQWRTDVLLYLACMFSSILVEGVLISQCIYIIIISLLLLACTNWPIRMAHCLVTGQTYPDDERETPAVDGPGCDSMSISLPT